MYKKKKGILVVFLIFLLSTTVSAVLVSDGLNIVDTINGLVVDMTKDGTLKIEPQSNMGSSTSVGGAVNMDNTKNKGVGMVLYSNAGSGILGKLMAVRCDNILFDEDCIHVSNDGTKSGVSVASTNGPGVTIASTTTLQKSHALGVVLNSQVDDTSAASIVSLNTKHSALQITGSEAGRGTVKISHLRPSGVDDKSASALSIDIQGTGTAAQGIFLDSSGGTIGKLLNIRNKGQEKLVLKSDGTLTVNGDLILGGNLVVNGCIKYKLNNVQQVLGTCT